MFNTSKRITQETIRLTGYVCSRPESKRTEDGEVLTWQYYRPRLASDCAAHVAVEYNRKGLLGVVRLVTFDPVSGSRDLRSSKTVLGSIDDLVHCVADFLDDLRDLTRHPHEMNAAASLLYDNGFLPGDDGEPGEIGRYWIRDDRYSIDCWQIIRSGSKTRGLSNPNDTCEVNYGSIQIGGWTSVHCPNLRMAIGMLDGGVIPRPRKPGFAEASFDSIMGVKV